MHRGSGTAVDRTSRDHEVVDFGPFLYQWSVLYQAPIESQYLSVKAEFDLKRIAGLPRLKSRIGAEQALKIPLKRMKKSDLFYRGHDPVVGADVAEDEEGDEGDADDGDG